MSRQVRLDQRVVGRRGAPESAAQGVESAGARRLVGHWQDDVAAALEQRPLVGQGADECNVVVSQAGQRLGQPERLLVDALQVVAEVDRLGPHQYLQLAELGVEELGEAGQQLLLLRVICARQRLVGAGDIEDRQLMSARA
ncbi:MAG: hypothetical protein JOZ81_26145 [Chloroflexi bacterium]|nr:hypothetical protein [Chloroflexota bacterium]